MKNKVNSFLLLASVVVVSAPVHAQEMNMDKNMVMDKGNMESSMGKMKSGMSNMKNMHPQGGMDPATMHEQMSTQDHQPMKPMSNSTEDNKH